MAFSPLMRSIEEVIFLAKVCRILISSSDHFFLPKYHQILKIHEIFMKIGKRITEITSNCTSFPLTVYFRSY
jgi:hypothetical protein